MSKINCWEFKKCGRELGGSKALELGVCPAAEFDKADGYLGGKNGGRACAYITGTFCSGFIQGTYQEKEKQCARCDFYIQLKKEHGADASVFSFTNYIKDSHYN